MDCPKSRKNWVRKVQLFDAQMEIGGLSALQLWLDPNYRHIVEECPEKMFSGGTQKYTNATRKR
jgi:hypothetical protein